MNLEEKIIEMFRYSLIPLKFENIKDYLNRHNFKNIETEIENVLKKLVHEKIIQKHVFNDDVVVYDIDPIYAETLSKKIVKLNNKTGIFEKHIQTFEAFNDKPFNQFDGYYHGNLAAGILPICSKTNKILLGYRSLQCNEPHTWGIFGGKSDDENESIQEIAVREFYEETRYDGPLELIPAYVYEDRSHDFEYHSYIGLVPTEFVPKLNWENEKAKWFSYDEVINLSYDLHFGLAKWINNLKNYYPNI